MRTLLAAVFVAALSVPVTALAKDSCRSHCNDDMTECATRCGANARCQNRCQQRFSSCNDACPKQPESEKPLECYDERGRKAPCAAPTQPTSFKPPK